MYDKESGEFDYRKVGVWEEGDVYVYSVKICWVMVVGNSRGILYGGIVERVVWVLGCGFGGSCVEG